MAVETPTPSAPGPLQSRVEGVGSQEGIRRVLMILGLAMLGLSLIRILSHEDELTSPGTFGATLRLAVPILLAGLGALYAERAGIVNIGLEGMMIMGTWFGAWAGLEFGPWQGALFGIIGGASGGLVHAVATVTFGVDHVVSGVAINILAAGVTRFLSVIAFTDQGGGATQSPHISNTVGKFTFPFLAGGPLFGWQTPDLSGWLARQHWFFVSDLGSLVKGLTTNLSWLTVIAFALVPLSFWVLWRTAFGLRLRSVGENPLAAESLGVPVYRMKYIGVLISGGLAGLGGAFLVLEAAGIYREGQTGGRGFIGLAALIFGNWRPFGILAGSGLFGFSDALKLRGVDQALFIIVLVLAVGLAASALWRLWKRGSARGLVTALAVGSLYLWLWAGWGPMPDKFLLLFDWNPLVVVGVAVIGLTVAGFALLFAKNPAATGMLMLAAATAVFWWWAANHGLKGFPRELVFFLPHITTLLVLAVAAQHLRPPAADGIPYRKGQAS
jgi:general nucleoside transport system permease protein